MKKRSSNNVFLIGYRGTGKSTVARLMAARLGWTWIDADEYLQKKYGTSIRGIFEQEGEAGFRDKEAAVLAELCEHEREVVATGGGVILRAENRARLRDAGKVVWLTADAATIWQRLQNDATTEERRPALTHEGGLTEIEKLLAKREPLYRRCADLSVSSVDRSPQQVAEEILTYLSQTETDG